MSGGKYAEIMARGFRNKDRYVSYLKQLKKQRKLPLDTLFMDAHLAAFEEIDCLDCGRCCSELGPRLKNRDIERLSRRERIKPASFMDKYLRTDEDGDQVFQSMPCPFFGNDGYCLVYEDRPEACRDYPHLDKGRQQNFIRLHIENLNHCPAVILAVEKLISG